VKALVIPPAWTDVWICASPYGHLQAVGRDAKGRKQFARLFEDAHKRKFDCVLFWALDRFTRGTIDGKALKLTVEAQTPQGAMTVIMTGDIDGDAILNGKAEIAGMGQMQWTAKRAKQ